MAERITGQALYEIHREANSELAYTWNDLPPYDRMVYVEVAIVLSGTYLAPLQGLVQDCLKLAQDGVGLQNANEHYVWEECYNELEVHAKALCACTQPYHSTIHQCQVSEQQIAQLQRQNDVLKAVLTSYRVFVKEAPIVSRYIDSAKWRGERADLLRMVDSLLKDEQEEKE